MGLLSIINLNAKILKQKIPKEANKIFHCFVWHAGMLEGGGTFAQLHWSMSYLYKQVTDELVLITEN